VENFGMRHTLRIAAIGLSLAAILGACSSTGSASPSAAAPSAAAPSVAPSEAPSAAPSAEASAAPSASAAGGGAVTLALADSSLGKIIVDGSGKTLYLFTPDEDGGKPTCYDACADSWPPLTADAAPTAGAGLDASKIKLVDRTDGTKQVAYGEYPLYYFGGDQAAGDTNGEGLNDKWYVVGADGEEIKPS
jgi:predicted lipoprotein with Yx(FWY)xxD motif